MKIHRPLNPIKLFKSFTCACLSLMYLGQFSLVQSQELTVDQPEDSQAKILSTEGISGDVDSKHRGPLLSVGVTDVPATETTPRRTKILVDAAIKNDEFAKYPIKFEFYVNRHLFATQMRSTELPGPVGIDVGPDTATIPFNYSVVATLLHPNRQYATILHGAVEDNDTSLTLACSLKATTEADAVEENYSNEEVSIELSDGQSASLAFDGAKEGEEGAVAQIEANLEIPSGTDGDGEETQVEVTGTISVDTPGTALQEFTVTGTATRSSEGTIQSLEVATEDGSKAVSCS